MTGKMISVVSFTFLHNLFKDSQNYAKRGEGIGEN